MKFSLKCERDKKEIGKGIYGFFHPSIESLMNQFAIVENMSISQEEYEDLLKILEEWKV